MPSRTFNAVLIGVIFCFFILPISAQEISNSSPVYEKTTVLIPMRDGVRLNTSIYAPKNAAAPLPFLMKRSPYGVGDGVSPEAFSNPQSSMRELVDESYIFVFQDIRGKYKSEGKFVMQRPPRDRKNSQAIDESTDAYDTIEWLLKNVPNHNGRAGIFGVSYDGWLAAMAMLDPHPALKAVSPQASPADMFLGDDFHHNGAFRLSYGFEYAAMMETSNINTNFSFDQYDTYEWYLDLGPLSNVNAKYLFGKIPTWNDFLAHPNYDTFWQKQAMAPYLTRVTVPTLNVAGWWDQEDFYGPLKIYQTLEKQDSKSMNYFIAGPWNHGGWNRGEGSKLGQIDFESATSKYFREKIQAPWFAHFLKDEGASEWPEAITFQTGSNTWQSYEQWPPRQKITERNLYFHRNGRLSFDSPHEAGEQEFDSYVSDPAYPVPYRPRPIEPTYYPAGSGWSTWLLEDQRFAHNRPDVLSWESAPLQEEVAITGNIVAHLFASTSGTDSDWIVKLIDVYPEHYPKDVKMSGYQLMIANEVFRGRFRNSFEKPEPIAPNQVNEYVIDLHSLNHRFGARHRIMVQVQSTWFPVIDRNPQKYVENIFLAKDSDYKPATQRVFRSQPFPSHVSVPVVVQ
ncbi:CocE/NonD family hydrolase [candidate division KSB1 bacterium]|nr:CocE/NonD family hydrolase [candidate division KSB1 bacterium]